MKTLVLVLVGMKLAFLRVRVIEHKGNNQF